MDVKFVATSSERLPEVPFVNGQIIYVADVPATYYDLGNHRQQVSNLSILRHSPQDPSTLAAGLLYIILEEDAEPQLGLVDPTTGEFCIVSGYRASSTSLGLVRPDNITITIDENGVLSATGTSSLPASSITYDNENSHFLAENVQAAIDEISNEFDDISVEVTTASADAEAALSTASSARTTAQTAQSTASQALQTAQSANTAASQATASASAAQQAAADAQRNANDANITASQANQTAAAAEQASVNAVNRVNEFIDTIPTKTSDLTNDSGFITKVVNDLVNYYTKAQVNDIVAAISTMHFEVVAELPTQDIQTNVIYLVPSSNPQAQNVKDEYININGTSAGWELIGSTAVDLSDYITTSQLNTALADYTTTANLTTLLAGKQDVVPFTSTPSNANKVVTEDDLPTQADMGIVILKGLTMSTASYVVSNAAIQQNSLIDIYYADNYDINPSYTQAAGSFTITLPSAPANPITFSFRIMN